MKTILILGSSGQAEKECPICGKEIVDSTRNHNKKYCSKKCSRYKHRDSCRESYKRWKKNNPEKFYRINREYQLKKLYNLTGLELELLLKLQKRKCAICHQEFGKKGPCVDHDHLKRKVRGIVCYHCNVMLGMAKDNPDILRSAAQYIEKSVKT